jgi:nitroimidazol reductase NimA-like FMN-containing flavoprotein (pyridoxamine 5'-phosphate oxidase superfamily)
MGTKQGDLALLEDPVAQELLASRLPARLAYNWLDGSPRVVPIWFHWTGKEVVLGSPPKAPKLKALPSNTRVAVSIDSDTWPYRVLQMRGTARVEMEQGVSPEYDAAAKRHFGEEEGRAWVEQVKATTSHMARIAITPEWIAILDFETRFPSAISG